ncbi:VOC family protein [Marinibaculum pumilum]|uniref:VOC family protein n=1 Tax=Marinibaculum pumilum TaxID=1766165 RepID=A0ABV7L8K7_9PROT
MAAPRKFAHVVFNTHRYEEMIAWYLDVFEARVQHRDDRLAFLTYDQEHHRFAFANLGPAGAGGGDVVPGRAGVNHLAYTWDGLAALLDLYKRLKARGILPYRPIRHGFTLSMYYRDPDGNQLEFQVDLMTPAAANRFMDSPAFAANPIGEHFDPDQLVARFEAGAPVDDLIFRSDQAESAGSQWVRELA